MKSFSALLLGFVVGSALAAPTSDDKPINFGYFKVTKCARDVASHIESHGSFQNGQCARLDWARSVAYKADFPHSYCDTKFFSDGDCSSDKEIAAPTPYSNVLIDNYYTGCWDDMVALNRGQHWDDDLVPWVNITVTCT